MNKYYIATKKDCFGYYLSEIGKYPVLSKDEEYTYGLNVQRMIDYSLLVKSLSGDSTAEDKAKACKCTTEEYIKAMSLGAHSRDKMLKHNLKLVVFIAKRYSNRGVEIEDLVQEGNIGLVRAVEKFDPTLGYKFSTYSSWWVKQSIVRAVANQSRVIRLPVHIYDLLNKIKKAERLLSQRTGRLVKASEVARELTVGLDKLQTVQYASRKVLSLDAEVMSSDTGAGLFDFFTDSSATYEREFLEDLQLKTVTLLSYLDLVERTILIKRFGLDQNKPMSYKTIGDELGYSSQTVRNTSLRTLRKLKVLAEENDVLFYEHFV